ncbi:MAG: RNA methyltransferase [Acidimicrobiales bacterium]
MADRPPPLSARNPHIASLRRLSRRRSARREAGALVVEGPTLLDEALTAGVEVREVLVDAGAPDHLWALARRAEAVGATLRCAADGVVARVATTEHPPPIVAVAAWAPAPLAGVVERTATGDGPLVVLVDVADPGNAGTIVRSAAAAGAAGVVAVGGVDLTNPKVVRASAGALFRLPLVVDAGLDDVLAALGQAGVVTAGLVVGGGDAPEDVPLAAEVALVAGNEAHGLPTDVVDRLDHQVTIPMAATAESLNVATATTVVLFEAARQRRAAG